MSVSLFIKRIFLCFLAPGSSERGQNAASLFHSIIARSYCDRHSCQIESCDETAVARLCPVFGPQSNGGLSGGVAIIAEIMVSQGVHERFRPPLSLLSQHINLVAIFFCLKEFLCGKMTACCPPTDASTIL